MLVNRAQHPGGRVAETARRQDCQRCGARIAADNRDTLCSPCRRLAAHAHDEAAPPTLPASFWEQPQILQALRERDFGKFLRHYRHLQPTEVTQATFACWLGMTQGQVSRIERGLSRPRDLDKLERWASALGVPERLLWFSMPGQTPHASPPATPGHSLRPSDKQEGEELRRRQFLRSAGAGAALVGSTLLHRQPVAAARAASERPLPPDAEIREMTERFRRLDNRFGGGHSRTVVSSYLTSIVDPLLKDVRGDDGAQASLFAAAAEMHQLAGWMSYDVGQPHDGRRHLREALRLCRVVSDDALIGEMFAGMSHHAAFYDSPETAVDLALAAREAAARTSIPALRAEAAVMEAHGLAMQGDRSACLRALGEAEQEFSAAEDTDRPPWLSYFDHAYLAAKFAHTFRDLRMPREAEAFARRSLEMSDGYERGRLFNTALLASTLADQRHVEEACGVATDAVRMTETVRSVRSAAYLADVGRRLAPFATHRQVRELYSRMAEAGLPTTAPT